MRYMVDLAIMRSNDIIISHYPFVQNGAEYTTIRSARIFITTFKITENLLCENSEITLQPMISAEHAKLLSLFFMLIMFKNSSLLLYYLR